MLDARLDARFEAKKARLDALRPLPRTALARLRERLILEWIYNSNAIEGNTLTIQETRLVLETGLTVGGKSLREHFEVINPTVIRKVDRRSYYITLSRADRGEPAPVANLVGRAVEHSLTVYLEALTPHEGPSSSEDRYITLTEVAQGTPYSQEYLSLLARKGRLEAIKGGRNWMTTRRAVEDYVCSLE